MKFPTSTLEKINMTAPTSPGLYSNLKATDYHASPAVSNSMLSDLADSPAHCYALHLNPDRPTRQTTDAMRLGTLTHTYILEPEAFRRQYAIKPAGLNLATKEGKDWKNAMVGLEVVTADDLAMAAAQRDAIMADPLLSSFFTSPDCESELSAFWLDKATGLLCRCRPDRIHRVGGKGSNRVRVLDLKTTPDITLDAISKTIANYGYHRQQAHYTNGLEANGFVVDEFVFGFVTKAYPFFAAPYVLDEPTAAQGVEEVGELITLFSNCKRSGEWPLKGSGPQVVGLPGWARRETEIEVSYAI